jgi:hypothetical protein
MRLALERAAFIDPVEAAPMEGAAARSHFGVAIRRREVLNRPWLALFEALRAFP